MSIMICNYRHITRIVTQKNSRPYTKVAAIFWQHVIKFMGSGLLPSSNLPERGRAQRSRFLLCPYFSELIAKCQL